MGGWQAVLSRQAFDAYDACRGADRATLRRAFSKLETEPHRAGILQRRDAVGRTLQIGFFGKFAIHYWDDFLVKELRIVRIERVQ